MIVPLCKSWKKVSILLFWLAICPSFVVHKIFRSLLGETPNFCWCTAWICWLCFLRSQYTVRRIQHFFGTPFHFNISQEIAWESVLKRFDCWDQGRCSTYTTKVFYVIFWNHDSRQFVTDVLSILWGKNLFSWSTTMVLDRAGWDSRRHERIQCRAWVQWSSKTSAGNIFDPIPMFLKTFVYAITVEYSL